MLARQGAVGRDPAVAPRDEPEVDDGDEPGVEHLRQRVDDEVGAVGAEGLVVEAELDSLIRLRWRYEQQQQHEHQVRHGELRAAAEAAIAQIGRAHV